MNIAIVGTGYVGLVSGACFASFGHTVTCVDTDKTKIDRIINGVMPIYEPGLSELVAKGKVHARLKFTTDIAQAVASADAVFIAVGTPTSRRGDGYADLTYVYAAARNIARHLSGYTVVINKSTVPVGTAIQVRRIIADVAKNADFDVASNPEFLREGAAIADFMRPDRVVIGVESDRAEHVLRTIYDPLYLQETPIITTDIKTAELIKYASNAFLAVKISFINEMSVLCDAIGADVVALAHGIGMDGRIGRKFLHPGPGYGGSCFPKDTRALNATAEENGVPLRIVEAAIEANNAQKARMIKKIRDALNGSETGKVIAVLGLAFKPETDDMREAPALTIIPALIERGAHVRVHDPHAMNEAENLLPETVRYCADAYETARGADAIVIMTEWNEYRALDLARIFENMQPDDDVPVFIDLRNVYEPGTVRAHGFIYYGVGRN
jgi:UDPglucose 6-dehydrogenase